MAYYEGMATKIAIIEDDQPIREMYELKLKKAGYTVKTAADGALGLELLRSYQPDLILLDLMMPQISGEELLKKFRVMPGNQHTKVIILTNVSKDEGSKNLDKLEISDYIVKANHTPSQVIEIVKKTFSK